MVVAQEVVSRALIQFIGLMLFAETPSQPTGALAIIPRVPSPTVSAAAPHVEQHTAFILFPAADYDEPKSTWKASVFPLGGGQYRYVLLNGEHITLSGNQNNAEIPHPLDTGLPSVSACCNLPEELPAGRRQGLVVMPKPKPKLRAEYTLPIAPEAAAVFDIPAGRLDACTAVAVGVHGRIDTLLQLDNDGSITLSASVGDPRNTARARLSKKLVLRGRASIWIVNAPWDAVTKEPDPKNGSSQFHPSHLLAYYEMLDPATCRAKPGCQNASPRFPCNQSIFTMPNGTPSGIMPTPPLTPSYIVDFQCSNSQWP